MSTLKDKTIAATYDQIVKRADTYVQAGTNIEIMDDSGTMEPTGLYLEGDGDKFVGIGTAAPYSPLHIKGAGEGQIADGSSNIPQLLIEGTAHTVGDSGPILCLWNSGDSADNDYIGKISFVAGDDTGATTALTTGTEYASIVARISDETDGTTDGLLYFYTDVNDVAVNTMVLKEGNVGIGTTAPEDLLDVRGTGIAASTQPTITLSTPDDTSVVNGSLLGKIVWSADDASDAGREEVAAITYKANETWNTSNREGYLSFGASNTGAYTDDIMVVGFEGGEARVGIEDTTPSYTLDVTGTGNLTSTGYGTWADYAEFFETVDGNDISAGTTVVLIDGKVRAAEEGESPMGVISDNPQFCGNADGRKTWQGKFVKDAYGNYEYELGEDGTPKIDMAARKISPDYDESLEYINRETRPEWVIVGLLGQIPVNKGQVVPSSWLKMKVITADVDMYYVFPAPQVIK